MKEVWKNHGYLKSIVKMTEKSQIEPEVLDEAKNWNKEKSKWAEEHKKVQMRLEEN